MIIFIVLKALFYGLLASSMVLKNLVFLIIKTLYMIFLFRLSKLFGSSPFLQFSEISLKQDFVRIFIHFAKFG